MLHTLAAHTGVELGPDGHTLPHAPQLAALEASVTSQPFEGAPSQSAKPEVHAKEHIAAEQVGEELAREGHATPQRPQLPAAVKRLTSQPFDAMPSQSAKPSLQAKPHAPAAQVARALAGAGHALSHAPQWATLVVVLVSQPSEAMPLQSPKVGAQA